MSRFTSVHDFLKAGSDGICRSDDIWAGFVEAAALDGGDPEALQAAFFAEQRQGARRSLERKLAGMTPPRIPMVEHVIEWAAQGGAIHPTELIALVREIVPEAFDEDDDDADLVYLAGNALRDFQRVTFIDAESHLGAERRAVETTALAEEPKRGNLWGIVQRDGSIVPCQPVREVETAGEVLDGVINRLREHPSPECHDAANAIVRHRLQMVPMSFAQPTDLWQHYEAPDLPRGLLPACIEAFAFAHAETMGADPAGLAMSALAVCAAAVPDMIKLQMKEHSQSWQESCRLWVGLVGQPSDKKTPIMKAAAAPLMHANATLLMSNQAKFDAWKRLPKKEQDLTPQPKSTRYLVQDATMEALQNILVDAPQGILSMQDELSSWWGAMDKYSGGRGSQADKGFWLQSFNGGLSSVDRVGRGSFIIPNLSISLLGGIQPEPLQKIAADSVDDGLIQRLLPVILRTADVGRDVPTGGEVGDYSDLVRRLLGLRPPIGAGNLSAPGVVRFDAGARLIRERLEREHFEAGKAIQKISKKLASHLGKHDGIFGRLCLLWHCVEAASSGDVGTHISEDVARRVAEFMSRFVQPSAIAFYSGVLGMSAGHEELMSLANYIVATNATEVTARDVQRSTYKMQGVDADAARRLCERLVAFGWLESMEPKQRSGGSPRWRVEPQVHVLFAARGDAERKRTSEAKRIIAEKLQKAG